MDSPVPIRQDKLKQWLQETVHLPLNALIPLAGDASFRRYYRVHTPDQTFVAMEAPPSENCWPFVAISRALREKGLHTPAVFAENLSEGFLLLTDFGDQTLLKALNEETAFTLYTQTLQALAQLQTCLEVPGWPLPRFTREVMQEECLLFNEWFLGKHAQCILEPSTQKRLMACFDFLTETISNQPYVFMHRDFHAGNLMVLPQDQIGILDFQDAFVGPITYDLVSLLRDCYVDWPDALVQLLVLKYRERIGLMSVSPEEFLYWFDMMGLQRHLKALLTFSRKMHRDHNPHYLQFIPRTANYIALVSSRYPQCKILEELFTGKLALCTA